MGPERTLAKEATDKPPKANIGAEGRNMTATKIAVGLLLISLTATIWAQRSAINNGARGANVFAYGDLDKVDGLNPYINNGPAERRLQQLMFNGLLQRKIVNTNNRRTSLAYAPMLATEYRYDASSRQLYLFELRDDIQFHDGHHFSAEDVLSTVNLIKAADTEHGRHIESCTITGPYSVEIRLDHEVFDVWNLFTFPILSAQQIDELGDRPLDPAEWGRDWWRLDIISKPVGTGPFMLYDRIQPQGLDEIALGRYDGYFDGPFDTAGSVNTIVYRSFANTGPAVLMQELAQRRLIHFAVPSFGLDPDLYQMVEYGNGQVYYIGFNFRPDRNITVCRPLRNGRGRSYTALDELEWGSILQGEDFVGRNDNVGTFFRRSLMYGIDRARFLSAIDRTTPQDELLQRIQTSVFPAGSPAAENPEVLEVYQKFIPEYVPDTLRVIGNLNTVLDSYLSRFGQHFVFVEKQHLRSFEEATRLYVPNGLFMLNTDHTQALSMKLVYRMSDVVAVDLQFFAHFLTESFAEMGIVLDLQGHTSSLFPQVIEEGDWDLILTSYEVPGDFNISPVFKTGGAGNSSGYSSHRVDAIIAQLDTAVASVQYADILRQLNEAIMMDLPVIPLFTSYRQAAFRRGLFATQGQPPWNPERLFDNIERRRLAR